MDENKSAIARLRAQIELECQVIQNMRLFSVGASHEAIKQRYQRLAVCHDRLTTIVGDEQATNTIVDIYDKVVK
jgi:hypothetical protein